MEILRAISSLPKYISWVRDGRLAIPKIEDTLAQKVKGAISDLLGNGSGRGWTYYVDQGSTEFGDPAVWSDAMPTWVAAFPELTGTTLTFINADLLGICNPENPDYALIMGFRNLTTIWRIHNFFNNQNNRISIERTTTREKNRSEYSGEEVQKLRLMYEAWQMAAKLKTGARNST